MSSFRSDLRDIHLTDYAVIRVNLKGGAWTAALEVHGWCAFMTMGKSYQDAVGKVVSFIFEVRGNSYGATFRKRIQALGLDKLSDGGEQ